MFLRKPILFTALLMITSCSSVRESSLPEQIREPAEAEKTCIEMAQNILLKENYGPDLEQALVAKKLLSFSNKFVTIEHPRLNWINRARASLNKSIKNWNNNKYPAFYIFNDEDVITEAKRYFQTMNSMVDPNVAVAPEATKNLELVNNWVKSFENYKVDVDQLLEERISLQYNLSLLKKLKLKDETRDIKLTVKRNGAFIEEIVTLRKSDKDLDYQIKRFKSDIKDLDGTLLKNGKIKDRMIRQAMLNDILTIVQREFEYSIKNTPNPNPELIKELEKMNLLIKNTNFQPTTYGVYRVTNKIFIRELLALSKLDVAYKKFLETPALKLKEIVNAFIKNRPVGEPNPNEAEKIGFFKRVYAKIASITPKQAAYGGAGVALAGIGVERYFWLKSDNVVALDDRTHEEQLDRTNKEAVKKSDDHSSVIEVEIDELIKK